MLFTLNPGWDLVAYRIFQGVGAACIFANSGALLTEAFLPWKQVGIAMGAFQVSPLFSPSSSSLSLSLYPSPPSLGFYLFNINRLTGYSSIWIDYRSITWWGTAQPLRVCSPLLPPHFFSPLLPSTLLPLSLSPSLSFSSSPLTHVYVVGSSS